MCLSKCSLRVKLFPQYAQKTMVTQRLQPVRQENGEVGGCVIVDDEINWRVNESKTVKGYGWERYKYEASRSVHAAGVSMKSIGN